MPGELTRGAGRTARSSGWAFGWFALIVAIRQPGLEVPVPHRHGPRRRRCHRPGRGRHHPAVRACRARPGGAGDHGPEPVLRLLWPGQREPEEDVRAGWHADRVPPGQPPRGTAVRGRGGRGHADQHHRQRRLHAVLAEVRLQPDREQDPGERVRRAGLRRRERRPAPVRHLVAGADQVRRAAQGLAEPGGPRRPVRPAPRGLGGHAAPLAGPVAAERAQRHRPRADDQHRARAEPVDRRVPVAARRHPAAGVAPHRGPDRRPRPARGRSRIGYRDDHGLA